MTHELRDLSLDTAWIYEAIVCTSLGGVPHAAPVGVWTDDQRTLRMDLYRTSRTLARILEGGAFVVGFPGDALALYEALHEPHRLRFDRARMVDAPSLAGAGAVVELSLAGASGDDPARVRGRVERVSTSGRPRLINRAEGLLTESLILATRAGRLGRDATLARLEENARVVRKVAPGSSWDQAMSRLLRGVRAGS